MVLKGHQVQDLDQGEQDLLAQLVKLALKALQVAQLGLLVHRVRLDLVLA